MSTSSPLSNLWQIELSKWISSGRFSRAVISSFGDSVSSDKIQRLQDSLLSTNLSNAPGLVELDRENLQNHLGAYSWKTNNIYIDNRLIRHPSLATLVLAHELGHWVEQQLNLEAVSHSKIRNFASDITEYFEDSVIDDSLLSSHSSIGTLTLPSGQTIPVAFFDTDTHTDWIKANEPTKFFNSVGRDLLFAAQDFTDAFHPTDTNGIIPVIKWKVGKGAPSAFGLQRDSASHFDFSNLSGGYEAIRRRYLDGLTNFNSISLDPIVSTDGKSNTYNPLARPGFREAASAGIQNLLYRFGQICHALEDFYAHSNWVELHQNRKVGRLDLFASGLDLPEVVQPGDYIPGSSNLIFLEDGPDWSKRFKPEKFRDKPYYFLVDTKDPVSGGGVVSATTLDGRTVYGVASGGVNHTIYVDRDRSVALYRSYPDSPVYTGMSRVYAGFGHGGAAGEGKGNRIAPLNKDKPVKKGAVDPRYEDAIWFSKLQVRNEWDRMGNLIFAYHGREGLKKFAEYALSPEYRQQYIETYSVKGGTWNYRSSKSSLLPASSEVSTLTLADSSEVLQSDTKEDSVPAVRSVRLFTLIKPESGVNSVSIDAFQFQDQPGSWVDTDFIIDRHYEDSPESIKQLYTPAQLQHYERGQRAVWFEDINPVDSLGSDIIRISSYNSDVPVYLSNIDLDHDRFVFAGRNGTEEFLPEELYQPDNASKLKAELRSRNVFIDYKPLTSFGPKLFVVSEKQLASSLVIEASHFASDMEGASLFFSSYDDSIPFMHLENGKLKLDSHGTQYNGIAYGTYVTVSDGTSTSNPFEIVIALAPKIAINGDSYSYDTTFSVDIAANDESRTVYASYSNRDSGTSFIPIASSVGLADGVPIGFNSSRLQTLLSTGAESGPVSFWIEDLTGNLQPLELQTVSPGQYRLSLNNDIVAQIVLSNTKAAAPNVVSVSDGDMLLDGLGFELGRTDTNITARDPNNSWMVNFSIELSREASRSSIVSFCLFDKYTGSVVDALTGLRLSGNDFDWVNHAEKHSVWSGSAQNMSGASLQASFRMNGGIDPDSVVLLPFVKVNDGRTDSFYSTFDLLNPGGATHFKKLSMNTIGFEDTSGVAGIGDFDDVVLSLRSLTLT